MVGEIGSSRRKVLLSHDEEDTFEQGDRFLKLFISIILKESNKFPFDCA